MHPNLAHPHVGGRHRPRPIDSTGARPAGIPAQVLVNWYWIRRTAMAPQHYLPASRVSA